jgi:hypothetical protein
MDPGAWSVVLILQTLVQVDAVAAQRTRGEAS